MASKNGTASANGKPQQVNRLEQKTDAVYLESFEQRLQLIRDRVRGVYNCWSTGLYLYGGGGTSKTFTVEQTLREENAHYVLTNSRLTGKGLFELLEQYPTSIHVLDDLETMLADKNSHGVLRSALWGGNNSERLITWHIGNKRKEVLFTSGIIMIANEPLSSIPTLKALATRISVVNHAPEEGEIIALMRGLAMKGYASRGIILTAEECLEVVNVVIELSRRAKRPVDLRLFVNGVMDRLQFEAGHSQTHWLDMLESRVKQRSINNPARAKLPNE